MFMNEYFGHEMSISESYMFMSKVIWSWDVYEWKWFGHEMSMSKWFGHEMSMSDMVMKFLRMKVIWSWDVNEWVIWPRDVYEWK